MAALARLTELSLMDCQKDSSFGIANFSWHSVK